MIINSFKKNGDNYIEEIGEINKGKDYQKTERNVYDLYLPYSSMKNKGGINRIMLFIDGGGWKFFSKEYIEFMCHRYTKYGYITATMNHTFLGNKECSIFRILDEIAACAADIKYQLKNDGFSQDDNKYEMAIGGISSGAHLSLLYGYFIKNSPIPVKFINNLSIFLLFLRIKINVKWLI
jgi:acetyl esterase/lipase